MIKTVNKAVQYFNFLTSLSPLACTYLRPSFSQFGEDRILDEHFRGVENGFYIEVGAYHPFCFSNSYLFYRKGWRGILVEPNPKSARLLKRWRKGDLVLETAVSTFEGSGELTCDTTTSRLLAKEKNETTEHEIAKVQVCTLESILSRHAKGVKVDFLSIDCEGHDLQCLESNDWKKYRPRVVLAEELSANPIRGRIVEYLQAEGYDLFAWAGPTLIFKEH